MTVETNDILSPYIRIGEDARVRSNAALVDDAIIAQNIRFSRLKIVKRGQLFMSVFKVKHLVLLKLEKMFVWELILLFWLGISK